MKKKTDKQTKTCCKLETVAQVYVASTQKAEATPCYSVSGYEEESEKKQGSEDRETEGKRETVSRRSDLFNEMPPCLTIDIFLPKKIIEENKRHR